VDEKHLAIEEPKKQLEKENKHPGVSSQAKNPMLYLCEDGEKAKMAGKIPHPGRTKHFQ
jgi:hypothetical protein